MIYLYDLTCEHRENPIGIDSLAPRFAWKIGSDSENVKQTSWHIVAKSGEEVLWDSGIQKDESSISLIYQGKLLKSRQQVKWTLTVTADGETACEEACFEMGLLNSSDCTRHLFLLS